MDLRRIVAIFQKDTVEAIRDARILLVLVVPLGLGLLYNFALDEHPPAPTATVVYMAAEHSQLLDALIALAGDSLRLSLTSVTDAQEARQRVAANSADLGLVLPVGFDAAVARGDAPDMTLIVPASPSVGGGVVVALLDPALRQMAGQRQPATITVDTVPLAAGESVISRIGERRYGVLTAVLATIAMIGIVAVPMVLAEEAQQKTLDALLLIASDADVIVAKALFGLASIAVAVPLLLALTELRPVDPLPFTVGLLLLSVILVGLGLLLGGIFSASQLNTWAVLFIVPVVFPAFVTGYQVPIWVETIAAFVPATHAARLALNGLSGEELFPHVWLSVGVLAVWCVAIYVLLVWRLSRREA